MVQANDLNKERRGKGCKEKVTPRMHCGSRHGEVESQHSGLLHGAKLFVSHIVFDCR